MASDGRPVKSPNPGSGGHAMYFNDQQASYSTCVFIGHIKEGESLVSLG